MSKSRKKSEPAPIPIKPVIPTHTSIDWSAIEIGVEYEFRFEVDFHDWDVMRNRAHNAAKRLNVKALTRRDTKRGVLKVQFKSPSKKLVSRKRAK